MIRAILLSAAFLATHVSVASDLTSILASEQRSEENKARDQFRSPLQTLKFFDLEPSDTVLEVWPGNGWYSEILGPYLKEQGQLIAATFYDDGLHSKDRRKIYQSKTTIEYRNKFSSQDLFGNIKFVEYTPSRSFSYDMNNKVDAALLVRMLHIWDEEGILQQGLADVYNAVKPGGTLAIVQHRSSQMTELASTAAEGYLSQQYVIEAAINAGFKFVASSEINGNQKDTKDYPRGVYALPPTLAMGKKDRQKYLEIGESDRMTLKFVKE